MNRPTKWIFWTVAGLLAAGLVSASAQILNPSFEESSDVEDWFSDQALHWGRWGNWINRETGWTPTRGGDCLIGYHHWRIEESDASGVFQDVEAVMAGKECTFNVYAYKDPDSNVDYIELRLEPLGGGEPLASHIYRMGDISKGKWKLLTVSGKTTAPGVRVLIVVQPDKNGPRQGALKFDDASLAAEE